MLLLHLPGSGRGARRLQRPLWHQVTCSTFVWTCWTIWPSVSRKDGCLEALRCPSSICLVNGMGLMAFRDAFGIR